MVSAFPSSRPFDHLEVIATLGVGGFGRVELVRTGFCLAQPVSVYAELMLLKVSWAPYLVTSLPAGEGAGKGHHICPEGHQEEARRGQQAGRAHPLREEDPR